MTETIDWPYDADQHDPLTAMRRPATSSHPSYYYLVSFDRRSKVRPTDAESLLLRSYIDYQAEQWLGRSRFLDRDSRPLDVEGGHNTTVFHKHGKDQWAYRRSSWTMGYLFWPPPAGVEGHQVLGLVELLDHMHGYSEGRMNPRWAAWKAAHPDVFSGTR